MLFVLQVAICSPVVWFKDGQSPFQGLQPSAGESCENCENCSEQAELEAPGSWMDPAVLDVRFLGLNFVTLADKRKHSKLPHLYL